MLLSGKMNAYFTNNNLLHEIINSIFFRLENNKPNWPSVNDCRKFQSNLMRTRRSRSGNSMSQFVVKIFVGVEYECPRGHRFMLASPDKVLRATSGERNTNLYNFIILNFIDTSALQ